ncbi:MAG: hypothetical protein V8R49_09710 [Duodenibacillus massiliensis]
MAHECYETGKSLHQVVVEERKMLPGRVGQDVQPAEPYCAEVCAVIERA